MIVIWSTLMTRVSFHRLLKSFGVAAHAIVLKETSICLVETLGGIHRSWPQQTDAPSYRQHDGAACVCAAGLYYYRVLHLLTYVLGFHFLCQGLLFPDSIAI